MTSFSLCAGALPLADADAGAVAQVLGVCERVGVIFFIQPGCNRLAVEIMS